MFLINRNALSFMVSGTLAFSLLAGCQRGSQLDPNDHNLVTTGTMVDRQIGDEKNQFQVLGQDTLQKGVQNHSILLTSQASDFLAKLVTQGDAPAVPAPVTNPPPTAPAADSLVLGFPVGLLNEQFVFGGVLTGVSNGTDANLGSLKLADLTPVHARLAVAKTGDNQYALAILGCAKNCTETSALSPLIGIPIVGVDSAKQNLMLDLAAIGDQMNLLDLLDPDGSATNLKTQSSKTVSFDYSVSTLVFDVQADMVPLKLKIQKPKGLKMVARSLANPPVTTFTTRWYLRLGSAFNPAFEARPPTQGVGFFLTERSASPKIERHAKASDDDTVGPLKYYVKNVPAQFQPAFASAFDEWNDRFTKMTGKKLLSYEFIAADDPKAKLLVAGDIRYHIVEWDLINQAPYGGFGPSIANQFTGEILSSNVLIQGPTIITLYSTWFKVSMQARDLEQAGRLSEAEALRASYLAESEQILNASPRTRFGLQLNSQLDFRVGSQTPPLEDGLQRADFDATPAGLTFDQYMFGYFHDMLTHELGHNLGLRHNFRGNLYASAQPVQGGVSNSVMEYLDRNFRYLDGAGQYDTMALQYGYLGTLPTKLDGFCTDEDVADGTHANLSAECSRDDATPDPFRFFEGRLQKAVDLLIARATPQDAPSWDVASMSTTLKTIVKGLGVYAVSSPATASKFTHFFTGGERPTSGEQVKAYVLSKLKGQLCDPTLAQVVQAKTTPEGQAKTTANIQALRAAVATQLVGLHVFQATELQCE